MNLNDFSGRFLEQKETRNAATESHVFKLCYHFYNQELESIKYQDVVNYVVKRRKEGKAASTINRELSVLKQMFSYLVRTGVLAANPAAEVKMEKHVLVRDRWITAEEEEELIYCSPPWLAVFIQFAAATGMRRGEIQALKRDAVNLDARTVIVRKSKNGKPRTIPLTTRAIEAIQNSWRRQLTVGEHVFVDRLGKPINSSTLEYAFHNAAEVAGIKDLHIHDLRHTFATRLVQRGVELYTVQRLLGHENPAMTQRYAHHSVESLRAAVEG